MEEYQLMVARRYRLGRVEEKQEDKTSNESEVDDSAMNDSSSFLGPSVETLSNASSSEGVGSLLQPSLLALQQQQQEQRSSLLQSLLASTLPRFTPPGVSQLAGLGSLQQHSALAAALAPGATEAAPELPLYHHLLSEQHNQQHLGNPSLGVNFNSPRLQQLLRHLQQLQNAPQLVSHDHLAAAQTRGNQYRGTRSSSTSWLLPPSPAAGGSEGEQG